MRSIVEQWGVKPQDAVVWGAMTLATFQTIGEALQVKLPDNVHLRKAMDLFTERLFLISRKNAFQDTLSPPGSNTLEFQGESVSPILPIRDVLLNYLDVNDLNQRISLEENDTGIVVTLRLTLTGINEQPRPFEISKEFTIQDGGVVLIDFAPILEIWPNFNRSHWNAYYTYFTNYEQNTFYAKPWVTGDEIPNSRSHRNRNNSIETEITKTSRLPEAIRTEYEGVEAGLLLISVPEVQPSGDSTWTVGVDFGTTNTTVYWTDQPYNAKPMEFVARLIQVTDPGTARESLYDGFLPTRATDTPFLSFFEKSEFEAENSKEPFLDGHIYFLNDYKEYAKKGHIVDNLKWSPDQKDLKHLEAFLKQLCLQCAAEAVAHRVKQIDWRYSFPTAFSQSDTEQFKIIWDRVIDACMRETGVGKGNVRAEPESVVTAKFFASTQQNPISAGAFSTGAVCIDVGGETSDISVWQDNKLYWQSSIRFAGRHIFLDLLKENPEFLGLFDVDSEDIKLLKNVPKDSQFYAQADALIGDRGQKLLEELAYKAQLPQVIPFVQLIAVGVAGLLYYVGLVLKSLVLEKEFEPRMPSVYIGGNGSRILHWLAKGQFKPDSGSRKFLKQIVLEASGFSRDDPFDLEISKSPKHEAAFGLVDARTRLDLSETAFDQVLSGEGFIENGKEFQWNELLTPQTFVMGLKTKRKLEQIERFVESFNRQAGRGKAIEVPIELQSKDSDFLFEQLQIKLQNMKGVKAEELHIEPLFILALKLLLKRKSEQQM